MKAAGFTATLHSLRHTHASTLIASGLDVLTVSRRLGHGSAALTLNVYGHLFKPDDRAAAIMEAALGEKQNEQAYLPLISGLVGAVIGSASSIITMYIQTRVRDRRERLEQVSRLAIESWKA